MQVLKKQALLKGTLSLSLAVIITKILGVAFKVPLSYILGDGGMGYFNTAYAIYGFFYVLCTAGVPKALTLILLKYRNADGENNDQKILSYTMRLFAKIGALATLLCITCAYALARMTKSTGAFLSIIFVAPAILFVSLGGVLRGYFNSREKFGAIAISQLIEGIVKLLLGLVFACIGARINASISMISALAILGITLGSVLSFIYMYILIYMKNTAQNDRQNCVFDYKIIRCEMLKNALPITVGSSLLNFSAMLDVVIITRRLTDIGMSGEIANALYGNYTTLAIPMFNLVISVLTPVATSYMPRLASNEVLADKKRFSSLLNNLLFITLFIATPAMLAFFFYSFDLLDVLFSVQSSAVGANMLIFLSLGISFLSALTVINTALESQGRMMATFVSLLIGCIVKIVSGYSLIGNRSIGIIGAPLSAVISYFISLAISISFLKKSGVRILAFAQISVFSLIGLISFYPSYTLIYARNIMGNSLMSMILSIGVSMVMYILILCIIAKLFKEDNILKIYKKSVGALGE